MQLLYFFLFLISLGLGISAASSPNWIIYRVEEFDINHGLFMTCLIKGRGKEDEETKCVKIGYCLGFDEKYNIYLPAVMLMSALGIVVIAFIAGAFLYVIGSGRIGFWITGVLQVIAGVLIIAACCLVITLPLTHDDEVIFVRDISGIDNPRKVYTPAFFIGWGSGLAQICSGIVAISSAHRHHHQHQYLHRSTYALVSRKSLRTLDSNRQ